MLNEISDFARVGPGEDILAEGETPSELIFLVGGVAVAIQRGGQRVDALADVLLPPAAVAGPAALMGLPSLVGVRTIASSRLILVPVTALRSLIEQDAELGRRFLTDALRELHMLQGECLKLKLRSSAQRLAQYLLALAGDTDTVPVRFVLPCEKRYLAGKIGCSQENLSRAFATLRQFGVVTQHGTVLLHDLARLQAFADPQQDAEKDLPSKTLSRSGSEYGLTGGCRSTNVLA